MVQSCLLFVVADESQIVQLLSSCVFNSLRKMDGVQQRWRAKFPVAGVCLGPGGVCPTGTATGDRAQEPLPLSLSPQPPAFRFRLRLKQSRPFRNDVCPVKGPRRRITCSLRSSGTTRTNLFRLPGCQAANSIAQQPNTITSSI